MKRLDDIIVESSKLIDVDYRLQKILRSSDSLKDRIDRLKEDVDNIDKEIKKPREGMINGI